MSRSRRHGVVASVGLAAACLLANADAPAAQPVTPRSQASRGVAGSIEITYSNGKLKAKPVRDAAAPMLVRVNSLGPDRYRIEYLGLVSGEYDLAELLEQE